MQNREIDLVRKSSAGTCGQEAVVPVSPPSEPPPGLFLASSISPSITVGVAHGLRGDVERNCMFQSLASWECKKFGAGLVMNSCPFIMASPCQCGPYARAQKRGFRLFVQAQEPAMQSEERVLGWAGKFPWRYRRKKFTSSAPSAVTELDRFTIELGYVTIPRTRRVRKPILRQCHPPECSRSWRALSTASLPGQPTPSRPIGPASSPNCLQCRRIPHHAAQ
jgi:hypothetical protein